MGDRLRDPGLASASGGERPGDRRTIERVTERIMGDGVPGGTAHELAVRSMRRVDRMRRERGQR